MMRDEVISRALALAGPLEETQRSRLEVLCEAAFSSLEGRLRTGMTPEDCREVFVTAAAMEAVALLESFGETEEFRAGDLTVKTGGAEARSRGLRYQAEQLIGPYLQERFLFVGV